MPATNFDDLEVLPPESDVGPIQVGSLLQKPFVPPPFTPQEINIVGGQKPPLTGGALLNKGIAALPPDLQDVLTKQLPQVSKAIGSSTEAVGNLAVGALSDLGQNIVSPEEGYHTENVQTALNNPIIPMPARQGEERLVVTPGKGVESVRKQIPAQDIEELPTYADVRAAPGALRIPASAAQGIVKSLPQLALTAAGGEVIGTPAAAAAVFGSTPQGFDPKAAAIAAALPFAGKYSGEIAGAIAKQFGVESSTALNWIKGAAGTAGPAAGLIAEQETEISKLPKEQQHEARINMWANIAGQLALGPMGVEFERGGAPRAEAGPEKISVEGRQLKPRAPELPEIKPGEFYALHQETAQPFRSLRERIGQDVGQVPTEEGGGAAGVRGSEEKPSPEPGARAGEVRATPVEQVTAFTKALDVTGQRPPSTEESHAAGMQSKTVADLDHLIEAQRQLRDKKTAASDRAKSATSPEAKMAALNEGMGAATKGQLPREAIEAATNTGSAKEGEGTRNNLGERPLDWRNNPEAKDWLLKNGAELWGEKSEQWKNFQAEAAAHAPEPKGGVVSEEAQRLQKEKGVLSPEPQFAPETKSTATTVSRTGSPSLEEIGDRPGATRLIKRSDYKTEQEWEDAVAETEQWSNDPSQFSNKTSPSLYDPWVGVLKVVPVGRGYAVEYAGQRVGYGKTEEAAIKAAEGTYYNFHQKPLQIENKTSMAGPGGTVPGDVGAKPELAQLTDALQTMAEQGKGKPQLKRAYSLGEQFQQLKAPVLKGITGLKTAAQSAKLSLTRPTAWTGFKAALGDRQLALSESTLNLRDFVDKAMRGVPNALDREAISNYVDNGGDRQKLLTAIAETDPKYEAGYQRALNLPPELRNVAENIRNYFESRLQDAIDAGVLEDGVEDYIHRIYDKDSPWKNGVISELRSGVFTGKPSLAKQRIFQYDYEAEKAGYKVNKDFSQRVAAYDYSLNKAIADRKFVKDLMQWKMSDGRPAIDVGGRADKVGGVGTDAAFLIKPQYRPRLEAKPGMTPEELENVRMNNRGDYVAYDHPALRKWKWMTVDAEGSPIMVQGDVLVHPEAMRDPKNPINQPIPAVFGKSAVRNFKPWGVPIGKAALLGSSTVKQTMLDLSGFHPVQITIHGLEHRANVPLTRWSANITGRSFKAIDLNDPVQRSLVSHGLNVVDHSGLEAFSEGVSGGGSSLFRKVPWLGDKLQTYQHWLFQDYIPRLKMEMATHALERNRGVYAKDLASGKLTEDQLLHITANQANAAFGELNYEMMGRNKTFQDGLRLAFLAPDFLEARGRFVGQALKGYGREQLTALTLGAATLYITARMMNKMISGEYHFEPEHAFDVMHNGRAYSIRTVQGDLLHLAFNPRSFAYTRLNPVTTRTLFEIGTGRDQFGRPRSALDQVKDFASTIVPISIRGALKQPEQKWWEGFINSLGVTERRATASDSVYKLADDFKKKHGIQEPGEFIYDPEKDPYRGTKLALMFDTPQSAAQEMKLAVDKGATDWKHIGAYFNEFGKKPFTGSKAREKDFWNTLSPDQQKIYKDAVNERLKMRKNAAEAFKILRAERDQQQQTP
jgi:hypothetical protein